MSRAPQRQARTVTSGYDIKGIQGRIIRALGRDIADGRYPPETLLPKEAELLEIYDASRAPLREAIKVLAAKGLVETRQRVGTRVRRKDLWNLFDSDVIAWQTAHGASAEILGDLLELRQIIEPAAARLAATRATLSDLAQIEAAQATMSASTNQPELYAEGDVQFHMSVMAASHNLLLSRFGHLVTDFLRLSFRLQQASKAQGGQSLEEDARLHRVIFEEINRGHAEGAAAAMLEVILDGKRSLLPFIDGKTAAGGRPTAATYGDAAASDPDATGLGRTVAPTSDPMPD